MNAKQRKFEATVTWLMEAAHAQRRAPGPVSLDAHGMAKAYLAAATLLLHESLGTDGACGALVGAAMDLARKAPKEET